jgi:hypothetical protein
VSPPVPLLVIDGLRVRYCCTISDYLTRWRMWIRAKNLGKFQYVAISTLFLVLLSSCSSKYPVDNASCEFYGETVWDKCFWFNNAGWIGFGISAIVYGLGLRACIEREKENKRGGFFLLWVWFLIGTPVILMFGSLALTQLIENILTSK